MTNGVIGVFPIFGKKQKIIDPTNGQVPQYNSSNDEFEPVTVSSSNNSSIIGFGSQSTNLQSTTEIRYIPFVGTIALAITENDSKVVIPIGITVRNAYLNVISNANTVSTTFTLRKNGVDTSLVITVPALTTGIFSDLVNSVSVSAGDTLDWKVSQATTGQIMGVGILCEVVTT